MSLWKRCFVQVSRFLVLLLFKIFYRLRFVGRDRIPAQGGLILASNHVSFLDPPLLQLLCRRPIYFTPRTTLGESRLYRVLTWLCPMVPLRRGEADLGAIRQLTSLLTAGEVVGVFPEQTRSADGALQALRPGFHMLARRARVPVVPMFIQGAHEIWPRRRRYPRLSGSIQVTAGDPIEVAHLERRQATEVIRQAIEVLREQSAGPQRAPADRDRDSSSREGSSTGKESPERPASSQPAASHSNPPGK